MGKPSLEKQPAVSGDQFSNPPPPYTENGLGSSGFGAEQPMPPPGAFMARQFPPAFNVYSTGMMGRHYMLGPRQEEPLYAISTHVGWSGKDDVILHSAATEDSPELASIRFHKFSRTMDCNVPPAFPGGPTQEGLHRHGWPSKVYGFTVETGAGGRQEFEWRRSHGDEIRAVGATWSGYKLVLLATGEVVAVWATANFSMTKKLAFAFLNSAAAGVLGERFAVMAVISALGMWEHIRRESAAAASSA